MSDNDKRLKKVQSFISQYHYNKLLYWSQETKLPMSRLLSIALDKEIEKDVPFQFDMSLPRDEYVEYAYADEAGKILNFMRSQSTGMGLDLLLLLRYDIGIPDKGVFLAAFRECFEKKMLEAYRPHAPKYAPKPDENYFHYRIPGTSTKERKKVRKKASKYETYIKLKKEFGE